MYSYDRNMKDKLLPGIRVLIFRNKLEKRILYQLIPAFILIKC